MAIAYKKYPSNWKTEIRPRILKRADNKCEICGVENHVFIRRNKEAPKAYWIVTGRETAEQRL